MIKVLFVCMGNICRSPMAQGVLEKMLAQAGIDSDVEVDSAATHDYNVGQPPDPRAQRAAAARGYDVSAQRARLVSEKDLTEFGYVLAMDNANLRSLASIGNADKARLFMSCADQPGTEIPDPYHGDAQDYEIALTMVEEAAAGLLASLRKTHKL